MSENEQNEILKSAIKSLHGFQVDEYWDAGAGEFIVTTSYELDEHEAAAILAHIEALQERIDDLLSDDGALRGYIAHQNKRIAELVKALDNAVAFANAELSLQGKPNVLALYFLEEEE